jgi:hypothetical protein
MAVALNEAGYQYCWLAGEAGGMAVAANGATPLKRGGALPAVTIGGVDQLPQPDDVVKNLRHPEQNVHAIFCTGEASARKACLLDIVARLRTRYLERGRPHVVILPSLRELNELGLTPLDLLGGFESLILPVNAGEPTEILPFGSTQVRCDAARFLEQRMGTRKRGETHPTATGLAR